MYTAVKDRSASSGLGRGTLVSLAAALSLVAFVLSASTRDFSAAVATGTGPWVIDHKRLKHVDPATHQYDQSLTLTHEAEALAVNPRDASLWVLIEHRLLHLAANGQTFLDLQLEQFSKGLGDPRLLALNAHDSTIWVGAEKAVLRFSASGQQLAKWSSSDELKAIALDFDDSLWVLTKKRVINISPQAAVLGDVDVSKVLPEPEFLALDRFGNAIWVAGKKQLFRIDPTDLTKPPVPISLPQASSSLGPAAFPGASLSSDKPQQIEGLTANPLSGDLWVASKDALDLYSRNLNPRTTIELKPYQAGELEGAVFAIEPVSGDLWLGSKTALLHFNSAGGVVARLPVDDGIDAIGLGALRLLPDIRLAAPPDNGISNNAMPKIWYTLGATCNALECAPGSAYLGDLLLDVELNGLPVGNLFARLDDEVSYRPAQRLPEGRNTLAVRVQDQYGRQSDRVTSSFVVDTVSPLIDLTSPRDGDSLSSAQILFVGHLSEPANLLLNGQPVVVAADNSFSHGPVAGQPGPNVFTLVATDSAGNTGSKQVTISIDNVPPIVTPPADLVIEATDTLTAVALGMATAVDNVAGAPVVPIPDRTGPFPLGVHTVTWRATDAAGNVGVATQTVTVRDTTPPVLTVPGPVTVTSNTPVTVNLGNASATDIFGPVTLSNDAPGMYPLGATTVVWTATDANGNHTTKVQLVTVNPDSAMSQVGWGVPEVIGSAKVEENPDNGSGKTLNLAADQAGNAYVIWYTGPRVGPLEETNMARYSASGFWEPRQEIAFAGHGTVAAGPKNHAIAAWTQDMEASYDSIMARRHTTGEGWGAPALIEQDTDRPNRSPVVAMSKNGSGVAVWTRLEAVAGLYDYQGGVELHHTLWAAHYDPAAGWGAPQMIGTSDPGRRIVSDHMVGIDGQGIIHVVWRTCEAGNIQNYAGCSPSVIRGNRYVPGSGWESPQLLVDNVVYFQGMQLGLSENGTALLVWYGNDPASGRIGVRGYSNALGWKPGGGALAPTGGFHVGQFVTDARVAADPNGNFVVLWYMDDSSGPNVLWAVHLKDAGSLGGTVIQDRQVTLDDNAYFPMPDIGFDINGNAMAVWTADDRRRLVSRYFRAGLDWGPITRIDSNVNGFVYKPRVVMDPLGNGTVVWFQTQNRNPVGESTLWGSRFRPLTQNNPPVAVAGPDRVANEGTAVTLDGTQSHDAEGPIYRYQWTQVAGPTVLLSGGNAAVATFIAPTVNSDVVLTFELKVVDAYLAAATDHVSITVQNLAPDADKIAPIVFPPSDREVEASATLTPVVLGNGYAMDNADGPLVARPDQSGPFPLGIHAITWSATDSAGNVGTAVQMITVRDTTPPNLNVPPDISVTSAVPVIVELGNAVASDLFPPVTVANDAPAQFQPGITTVTWRATDANGNTATALQMVIVAMPSGEAGWSLPEIVDTGSGYAWAPQAAFNDKGNGMVVWIQAVAGVDRVHARSYVNGTGWGAVAILSAATAPYVSSPRVSLDRNDNAVVIWSQAGAAYGYQVWSSHHSVVRGWSPASAIGPWHSYEAGDGWVATDASGNAIAVWGHRSNVGGAIWANRYSASGAWGTAEEISRLPNQSSGSQGYPAGWPRVVIDQVGRALAVWVQNGNIVSNRYLPGQGWDSPLASGPGGLPSYTVVSLGMDGTGNAVVAWTQYHYPGYRPWAKRYLADSGTWEPAVAIGNLLATSGDPEIAVNTNGQAAAVWIASAGARLGLYATVFSSDSGWSSQQLIDTSAGDVGGLGYAAGVDRSGNAMAVWNQGPDVWQGGDIWVNRYVAGSGWGTAERIEVGRGKAEDPHLVVSPSGAAFAVWSQAPDDPTVYARDILFSRYTPGSGAGGNPTPPVVIPPADLTVEASAVVTPVSLGAATAVDDVDGPLPAVPDRTGPFPLGIHRITWSAVDSFGNVGRATQTVVVQDTTPPVLLVPPDVAASSAVPIALNIGAATATDIFTPITITNDAPAMFPTGVTRVNWTATDPNGNSSTAVQRVTVSESFTLAITSPVSGQTLDSGVVLVTGTLEAPANTGVVVNGIIAAVDRTVAPARFYAVTPLQPGANTIVATATRPDAATLVRSVNVTVATASAMAVTVDPQYGVAPLKVRVGFLDQAGSGIQHVELDFNGDGTNEIAQNYTGSIFEYTYASPGVYLINVRVVDGLGIAHAFSHPVEVVGFQQQDAVLRAVYLGMLDRLKVGDIEGALTSVTGGMKEKYRTVFKSLDSDLPAVSDQLGSLEGRIIGSDLAEYAVVRDTGGHKRVFLIYFLRSDDGIWRIDGM